MVEGNYRVYNYLLFQFFIALGFLALPTITAPAPPAEISLVNPLKLRKYVDELPDMPRIKGYYFIKNGSLAVSRSLKIGMFQKKWKFHRDLPATAVFAYGESKHSATIPGPTIETLYGVDTHVSWRNHLPSKHILPWDPTIPAAIPSTEMGIPTVVHLHGGIDEPESDGNSESWFTAGFRQRGPAWVKKKYHYHNLQHPGTLWYHDHAMGLTRINLLAGLIGAYIIRHPQVEVPLGLPYDDKEFDLPLVVFDRGFYRNGSIFMNSTGNNPTIHPQWQPEYFGDSIIVNGKAWPYMVVRRRRYRFRIINASNARFFNFYFLNNLTFVHVASDSAYHELPTELKELLLAPSEIADVVIDFSKSKSDSAVLANNAPYPYPPGDPVNEANSRVMKFIIKPGQQDVDTSCIPKRLIKYPSPTSSPISRTRYIALYEYTSASGEPTHMYINGEPYEAPATEKPKVGTSEIWYVINFTDDNHPLHIHLGLFTVLEQRKLVDADELKECMMREKNDAVKCQISKYARGKKTEVPAHEKGWKNVFKMMPGYVTKIVVRFSFIHSNASYPFDATADPGYVYHCHILDHEDNVMMRPLKIVN